MGARLVGRLVAGRGAVSENRLYVAYPPALGNREELRSSAERLAQILTLGLPPLVQDRDVGADGEVPDAHVEEVLRLIRGADLGAAPARPMPIE
jgi:hypothetical protein